MYSALADYYDMVVLRWSGARSAASFYVDQLPIARNEKIHVLDIGCGTGLYALAVLRRFPNAHVVAFDSNAAMCETLRRKLYEQGFESRAQVVVADMATPIPALAGMQFDLMIASGVLEYGNLESILNNLMPYLTQDGMFFDAAIQDSFLGRLLAAFWGCKPMDRTYLINTFERNRCQALSLMQLPESYILLRFMKEGHLFKRTG
jgi:precorrin-6B methylase 2